MRAGVAALALAAPILILAASVLAPGAWVVRRVASGVAAEGAGTLAPLSTAPLARSVAYALLIALVAATIAWPVAWSLVGRRSVLLAPVLAPLLAPGYLAYAGLGLLRAPGTWLGDLLIHAGESGPNPWPLVADRVLAVLSLALWVWPLACVLMWLSLRRVDPWVWESMRLEPMSHPRRLLARLSVARAGIGAGVLVVALTMLGSATPLQLAQIDTYAVELWSMLASTGPDEQWRVFAAAWPTALVAVVAGAAVLVGLSGWARTSAAPEDDLHPRPGLARAVPPIAVALTLGVPALLLANSLGSLEPVRLFIRLNGDAMADSARVALLEILGAGALGLGVSLATAMGARRAALGLAWILLACALVPGVLVGTAVLSFYTSAPWLRPILDWSGIVAIGHLARFGFVVVLLVLWTDRSEAPELGGLRALDGADGVRGWTLAVLPTRAPAIAAGAIVIATLGLHEIEAAVMLAPPGTDSLARRMLELLHFARERELSSGALLLLGASLAGAAALIAPTRALRLVFRGLSGKARTGEGVSP